MEPYAYRDKIVFVRFRAPLRMQDYEVPQNSLIPENIHGGFIG
jgi:hypothetical protein